MGDETNPAWNPAGFESGTLFQWAVIPGLAQPMPGTQTCLFLLGILGPGLRLRQNRDDDKLVSRAGWMGPLLMRSRKLVHLKERFAPLSHRQLLGPKLAPNRGSEEMFGKVDSASWIPL